MIEQHVFVTDDSCIRSGGRLDETDLVIIDAFFKENGKPVFMSIEEMGQHMQKTDPERFRQLKKICEQNEGHPLTIEEFFALLNKSLPQAAYIDLFKYMTPDIAGQIRAWRVDEHYSWRSIARAAYMLVRKEKAWRIFQQWEPPSNQMIGISLCSRAAELLGENYRQLPWN